MAMTHAALERQFTDNINGRDNFSELEKLDKFRDNIREDTMKSLIETIKVSDSYFYAEMKVFRSADPFGGELTCVTKINLFNSEEFRRPNRTNEELRGLKAKEIVSETIISRDVLESNKVELIKIIYEIIAKQITKDLMAKNHESITMAITSHRKFF